MKKIADIISMEDIKSWMPGDNVVISAGTDTGKSYFAKNVLYDYSKSTNKRILFLVNRLNCKKQFHVEIEMSEKDDIIDIITYQKIEHDILNYDRHINYSQYGYIICDEWHYFIDDAIFNKTTDISYDEIINQTGCVKILMSATGNNMEEFLLNDGKKISYKYELEKEHNPAEVLEFFSKGEDIEYLISMIINKNEKAIVFIQSANEAYSLHMKYEQYSLFNCASNNILYKYVNEEKIDRMLETEMFEENILITTACLDTGVNIIDESVKHIIVDMSDISSMFQCLGRKRCVSEDDKVSFYIKDINNYKLAGMIRKTECCIEKAEYLEKNGTQAYVLEYPRQIDESGIIYDISQSNRQKNMASKKANRLMLAKRRNNLSIYKELIKSEHGYRDYVAKTLGFVNEDGEFTYKLFYKNDELQSFLWQCVEEDVVMHKVQDRLPLIEMIDAKRKGRKQSRKLDELNAELAKRRLPYKIIVKDVRCIEGGERKRYKSAWKVEKVA